MNATRIMKMRIGRASQIQSTAEKEAPCLSGPRTSNGWHSHVRKAPARLEDTRDKNSNHLHTDATVPHAEARFL
jgi:hypothetical protein